MDILLIAGLWLDGSAWDDVVPALRALGHRPSRSPCRARATALSATLDDQVGRGARRRRRGAGPPLVVGHSAACTLAWLAADARPDAVARVALIGGFPTADGDAYADFFEIERRRDALPRLGAVRGAGLRRPRRGRPRRASRPPRSRCPRAVAKGDGAADRRAALRRPGRPGVPGVQPRPGPGVDRRR